MNFTFHCNNIMSVMTRRAQTSLAEAYHYPYITRCMKACHFDLQETWADVQNFDNPQSQFTRFVEARQYALMNVGPW